MVNFRLSEMEYRSFKNNVAATCGSDNGAVSRYLRERIFTETYDIKLLRSLCSDLGEMKAKLDHELKTTAATGETSALQRFLEDNVHYLSRFQEKLSSAIDNSPKESPWPSQK